MNVVRATLWYLRMNVHYPYECALSLHAALDASDPRSFVTTSKHCNLRIYGAYFHTLYILWCHSSKNLNNLLYERLSSGCPCHDQGGLDSCLL
jgi:hypothetical protein